MNRNQFVWLFFGLSGRLSRLPYLLAGLLLFLVLFFPAYQIIRALEEERATDFWVLLSWISTLLFLWCHVALGVKRLHDFGKPGTYALLIPLFVGLAFIILCIYKGDEGANAYGRQTNAPK